ncbi:MAG: chromosomal replication initiator protein DnaA [Deltaproteobacteria bacterium]|jgi:chromosomal replication initiator protein|nr:chromosomal replication initiator protein DnaA [Deltaproteobacteria bacterium]
MDDISTQVKERLLRVVDQDNFRTWIEPIRSITYGDGDVMISVPNSFFRDWIVRNFEPTIRSLLAEITHVEPKIQYLIEKHEVRPEAKGAPIKKQVPISGAFAARYTFDTFVVGSSNQFANAACLAVSNNPGKVYNPLFIYGGVGLGKTHLLNAIGNFLTKHGATDPARICFITAEEFTNELINSLRYEKMDEFRNRFRRMDILLIDDIQFIAGKERTQAEFFHTFNALYDNTKQIVVTSDKFPRDIVNFEERLRSRFEWGLIADIQPPDLETRVAILNKKAELENLSLPQDVAFYLASNIEHNVRVLEGSLVRVGAFASLHNAPITMELAKEIMGHIIKEKKHEVTVDSIIKEVAAYFSIKTVDLKSDRRIRSIILPRQIAIYLARKLTDGSLVSIGEKFGGKDHATVIHSVKKIEQELKIKRELKDTVENLEKKIKST